MRRLHRLVDALGDPLGARPWVYAWLAVYFARLAIWHAIDRRWGRP